MQLNQTKLSQILIKKPNYNRDNISVGIVHLGVGAFHRAHQAVYIDRLLSQQPEWAIIGASLRNSATAEALNPQNGLYTLIEKSEKITEYRVIGSVVDIIVAHQQNEKLLQLMSTSATRIVSLTITEKGYCLDPVTGQLNSQHPDILTDIATPRKPISAPGILVEMLRRRYEQGSGPVTILSCDNLPSNGKLCRGVILAFAAIINPDLKIWIAENITFPCTMVDRMTPATIDDDRALLLEETGIIDNWPVVAEPYSQWVIEDNFCAGRPAFERVGVEMVTDVEPFETMKLRMLNGSHSALAYMGSLAGYKTVAQAIGDKHLALFVKDLLHKEVAPTLNMPNGIDLDAYISMLFKRFKNPKLHHKLIQIAADGSQKIPQRILNPVRERLRDELPIKRLTTCIAAWLSFILARANGKANGAYKFELNDPLSGMLRKIVVDENADLHHLVSELLKTEAIFGADLVNSSHFLDEVHLAFELQEK